MTNKFKSVRQRFFLSVWFLLLILFPLVGSGALQKDEVQKRPVFSDKIPLGPKDLELFTWRHIGPWPFSGRITNFAVPSGQSQTYYVLTASGGVWKTVDGGIHFEPIFENTTTRAWVIWPLLPPTRTFFIWGRGSPSTAGLPITAMGSGNQPMPEKPGFISGWKRVFS